MREANTTDFVFFPSGIFVIEYLCNLHLLPIGLPMKMEATGGAGPRDRHRRLAGAGTRLW